MSRRNFARQGLARGEGALGVVVGLALALFSAAEAPAQDLAERLERSGQSVLKAKHPAVAAEQFERAAEQAEDPALRTRLDFRRATALQLMAMPGEGGASVDPADARRWLDEAASLYGRYLDEHPDSAAAAYNLARAHERLWSLAVDAGDAREAGAQARRARHWYTQAIAHGDQGLGLMLENQARFLAESGSFAEAQPVYARLIRTQPLAPRELREIIDLHAREGLGEAALAIRAALDAGSVGVAADAAMDLLRETRGDTDEARVGLLALAAAGWSRHVPDATGTAADEARRALGELRGDPLLGEAVADLLRLDASALGPAERFNFWRQNDDPGDRFTGGIAPPDAYRALARALGTQAKLAGDTRRAEAYFTAAADLLPGRADPLAVRALVQLRAEQDDIAGVDALLDRYRVSLFEGKERAYRAQDYPDIFEYHQTLGELYTLIGRWGDSRRFDSAIFQLEHAREASELIASRAAPEVAQTHRFTPELVDMLATAYDATEQPQRAVRLRVDQARAYDAAGEIDDARRVLAPLDANQLTPELREVLSPAVRESLELRRDIDGE